MYNPNFGRIRFIKQSPDSHAYIKSFNTDHINFHVKNWHVRFYYDDDAAGEDDEDRDEEEEEDEGSIS